MISLQIVLIALLVSLLVGIVVGYQLRTPEHGDADALQLAQKKLADQERAHESRLRDATLTLQQDYERQLTSKIEHYQDQMSQRLAELEQEYQARLDVFGQAQASDPQTVAADIAPDFALQEFDLAVEQPISTQDEDLLTQKVNEAIAHLQQDYETRLAEKSDQYQSQLAQKIAELEAEYASRLDALMLSSPASDQTDAAHQPLRTHSTNDEQALLTRLEDYQTEVTEQISALRQDYEARIQQLEDSQPHG